MTEKRFECLGSGEYWDNQEDYGLEPKEVTALLNALNDKNEQLKIELLNIEMDRDYYKSKASSLEEGYLQLQDREIRLKKENEQLKSVLLGVINRLYYCENCLIGEMSSHISEDELKLKEEFKKEFGKYGWKE